MAISGQGLAGGMISWMNIGIPGTEGPRRSRLESEAQTGNLLFLTGSGQRWPRIAGNPGLRNFAPGFQNFSRNCCFGHSKFPEISILNTSEASTGCGSDNRQHLRDASNFPAEIHRVGECQGRGGAPKPAARGLQPFHIRPRQIPDVPLALTGEPSGATPCPYAFTKRAEEGS